LRDSLNMAASMLHEMKAQPIGNSGEPVVPHQR